MGLTIHYKLHAETRSPKEARQLVEQLRQRALDLPLKEVGEVVELTGDACDFHQRDHDDPLRWLLVQAGQWVIQEDRHYMVMPKHIIAFSTYPGDGCEQANFGLAIYPAVLEIEAPRTGRNRRLRTGIKDWSWSSFCKTQYASQHGVENFLRCHLSVIRMLDHAKELGILASVSDEGGFWEKREPEGDCGRSRGMERDGCGVRGSVQGYVRRRDHRPHHEIPRLRASGGEGTAEEEMTETEQDEPEDQPMECCFCGKEVDSVEEAVELGWHPDFWHGNVNYQGPVCAECQAEHLLMDEDGEFVLKPDHPLPPLATP